ncbi:MAG: ice-binding family protein, partial [Kiritimatiellaeota bacterium]|nr:ice-binding family protein [Kiritimatiellota bacterium]
MKTRYKNATKLEKGTNSMNIGGLGALGVKMTKRIFMGLALSAAMTIPCLTLAAPVNLGEATHFTILSYAGITTTGGGIITGDVGTTPLAGSYIGIPAIQVIGTIYEVDSTGPLGTNVVINPTLLTAAKGDLTTAYNDAAGRTLAPSDPAHLNPNGGNIGGQTLSNGVYKFTGTAYITGADLTLAGGPDDVWIFQCAADLQMDSYRQIILTGGAQARNVFWQVGSSAVIDTYSVFKGTIMAYSAVTLNNGSTLEGRALALNAAVTFNGTGGTLPSALLTVYASPTNGGSVTGSGFFLVGSSNPISATASSGWDFTGWLDGNTNSLRSVVVFSNSVYTAIFVNTNLAPATITVNANPTNGGAVTGNGTFLIGSIDPISATASNGWRFVQWSDGDTNALRNIVVLSNSTYTANFTNLQLVVLLQQGDGGLAGVWTLGTNYLPATWDLVTGALGGNWVLRGMNQNRILL